MQVHEKNEMTGGRYLLLRPANCLFSYEFINRFIG
jgi:hypothetical protein